MDVIQEELRGWHEEVNEIKEMMSSLDEGAEDFSLQLQEFVTVSAIKYSPLSLYAHTFKSLPCSPC